MSNILETSGLTVTFGGLNACDKVDLIVPEGKFVGLIGPNGAGKTTFIDAITGYVPTSAGNAASASSFTIVSSMAPGSCQPG